MNACEETVFVFGLEPGPESVLVFPSTGVARAHLNGYLFAESLYRALARHRVTKSDLVIYTISGQLLRTRRIGLARYAILVPDGPLDDAGLQASLDEYAARRGLPVPIVDRVALANQRLREEWELRRAEPQPQLPGWLARRMPEPETGPPQI